ncbi:MAG TPA: hypothetical protein VNI55_09325 [Gaiellaceae bacterium]|nr:hypothetical protein [Gaiellaceae bacterium]
MEAILAFGAALLALRLTGLLLGRWRLTRTPELLGWAAGLGAYALGAGALAWGAAGGWSDPAFRAYYLFGGLLTAPLLGAGSLLGAGRKAAGPVALIYSGLAIGITIAVPLTDSVGGSSIPEAQAHLDLFPARILAIAGNVAGSVALIAVALLTIRRRPVGNSLLLAGFALAAIGSALAGLGASETAAFIAVAAVLLYAGTVSRS